MLPDLEEQPPRPGVGQQHADRHMPGRRRASSHLVPGENARAAAGPGAADVRVEVLERPLWKKIACASAPYHGVSVTGLPCGSVKVMYISDDWIAFSGGGRS